MVGSSKILTVSYGTFSCTLEGFDDPFNTMRSIAEYFRDLAADDRYFGAEPPTPDAEMLHRIAERDVSRRVESRVGSDGIVLRQVTGEPAAPEAEAPKVATAPAAAPVAEDLQDQEDAPVQAAPEIETDTKTEDDLPQFAAAENLYAEDEEAAADMPPTPIERPAPPPEESDDSVAAKLSRIRAVVSGNAANEDEAAPDALFGGSIESAFGDDATVEDAEFEDIDARATDSNVTSIFADRGQVVVEDAADPEPAELDDEQETVAPEEMSDAAAPEDDVQADVSEDPVALEEEEAESAAPETELAAEEEPEDLGLDLDAEPEAVQSDDDAEEEDAPEADLSLTDAEAEVPEDTAEAQATAEEEVDEAQEDASDPDQSQLGLAARIVQLKRSALEAAQTEPVAVAPNPESSLSDEDEADLMRELAEADLEDREDQPAPEAEVEAEAPEAADTDDMQAWEQDEVAETETAEDVRDTEATVKDVLARATRGEDAPEDMDDAADAMARHPGFDDENTEEAAFDRILEQTNSRMDDDEGSRRRSAIAHLKAAVAATKADRLLKRMRPDDEAAEEQSQYRDDLAKVVQPRRPLTQPRDPAAPDVPSAGGEPGDGTGPLVLVSEQRVDPTDGDIEDGDEVLPRRVNTRESPAADTEEGFAAFASKVGATALPDLLEAAAAYTAFVEGNKLFSRPQLMRRVAHVETGEQFTREAGLRSFGQLLRQGKIQKLKRGQFTISEETRFNPQARLAGE